MEIPTKEECIANFDKYKVPYNIKDHCLKVAQVATFLAKELKKKGQQLNVEFVEALALQHDLFKVATLKELKEDPIHHPEAYSQEEIEMWQTLRKKYLGKWESEIYYEEFNSKYPEFSSSMRNLSDPANEQKSWDELVVHYADWRLSRTEILLLAERLEYLMKTYPHDQETWMKYESVVYGDEARIFAILDFEPEDLKEKVEAA